MDLDRCKRHVALAMPLVLGCCVAELLPTSTAHADLIAYDGFDYELYDANALPAELRGNNGGSGWGGEWASVRGPTAGRQTLVQGSLQFPAFPSSGNQLLVDATNVPINHAYRELGMVIDQQQHPNVWISFLISKEAGSSTAVGTINFSSNDQVVLSVGHVALPGSGTSGWGLASSQETDSVASDLTGTSDTHLLVTHIDFSAQTASLWLDPQLGGDPAFLTTPTSVSIAFDRFDMIEIYAAGGGAFRFDELRLGSSFQSVTAVPEPTSLALAGIAALTLCAVPRRYRLRFRNRTGT
jgi:hypothetical protein